MKTNTNENKIHQADALARWHLEKGNPEPMRKRLKEQEKTHAVSAYLENCEMLDAFEEEYGGDEEE